jgi:hypothetical protein
MAHRWPVVRFLWSAVLLVGTNAVPAAADENGASVYLLGSGVPGAGELPPLPGLFFDNSIYVYSGGLSSRKDFQLSGNIVADVDATLPADFVTFLWVPTTNAGGGTLAIGGALPVAAPMIDAKAVLTGPAGRTLDGSLHDSAMVAGDPLLTAEWGLSKEQLHFAVSGLLNIPIGNYREHRLANIAFHRWAGDLSLGVSWKNAKSGWAVSGKAGVTINGKNDVTDYNSGNDLHFEASVEKTYASKWSTGIYGYQFWQISGDSGSGARLGSYEGKVTGLGGTVGYTTVLGRAPTTFRLRVGEEFWEQNRMGGTVVMFDISLPLSMKLPPH